jgi:serine protease AprX
MLVGPNFKFPRGAPHSAVGICPSVSLVDIRVFDKDGNADELNVITALAFVQWLNRSQRLGGGRMIDGVNLSLAVPFAADQFACGWTPVCREADRCVYAGIVVVAAAGNAGFDPYDNRIFGTGVRLASITDPGNTESVITVGATDPSEPHRFGPISLSGRGPTADGRHKPDLLAPGSAVWSSVPGDRGLAPLSGTSMAVPHVSGAAAMLLARFPELRGQPQRVKALLCGHATDLERARDFQGHGLLDILRTLQAY